MSILFNGSTDYLIRSASLPSPSAYTFCAWVRFISSTGTYSIINILENTGTTAYCLLTLNGIGTQLTVNSASEESAAILTMSAGWYFVAMTNAGTGAGNIKGYARAESSTTLSTQSIGGASFTSANMYVGGFTSGEYCNMDVHNPQVFDRVLTQAELLDLSYLIRPRFEDSLHIWSPLWNENDVNDYSGNAKTWTTSGTLTEGQTPPISYGGKVLYVQKAVVGGAAFMAAKPKVISQAISRTSYW